MFTVKKPLVKIPFWATEDFKKIMFYGCFVHYRIGNIIFPFIVLIDFRGISWFLTAKVICGNGYRNYFA